MSNRIPARLFGLAIGALIAVAAAGSSPAQQVAAAAPAEITIDNFAFEPASLTVARGTRVTWVNRDEEPHTVVSADKELRFKSQALDTNDKFSFVFDKPGTYKYFCSVHTHMVGTVEVK
jgi:plastocyanin